MYIYKCVTSSLGAFFEIVFLSDRNDETICRFLKAGYAKFLLSDNGVLSFAFFFHFWKLFLFIMFIMFIFS